MTKILFCPRFSKDYSKHKRHNIEQTVHMLAYVKFMFLKLNEKVTAHSY